LLTGLVDKIRLAELHQHALGAGGDQGMACLDQKLPALDAQDRNLGYLGGAGFERLEDLFHQSSPLDFA
jgi:hypothetical protein